MKKIFCVIFALLTVLLSCVGFSACDKEENYPLTVNGTPVNGQIFCYYLNEAFSSPEALTQEERITYATNMCIRYVAVNTAFKEKGLSLSPAESAESAENANVLWNMFEEYYTSIGVSKEAFIKIQTSLACTEKLRLSLFDKGGMYEIADSELREYFSENYAAFKLIRGYLFTTDVYGNTVEYTEAELEEILDRYNDACDKINAGVTIDFMYSSLAETDGQIQQTLSTEVIADGDPYYPESFYSKVKAIDENSAALCVFDDYLYLVYRVGILSDVSLFEANRAACLKAVSENPLQSEINRMCNAYTSVRKPKLVQQYYKTVSEVKTNG